ncbi:uncharacterized protein EMH_0025120 [Eimeria mitis]|uniref:Uncharacterized protein n=1 Tax=Eimeria mitis TaxID=44415 RepID=U6KIK1_9EIME|nr:uncharacterized protein EMH_0025120 [Eimeria mitis]CDJ35293.1 hypothetical protein, conserved [Eimeria mitis]
MGKRMWAPVTRPTRTPILPVADSWVGRSVALGSWASRDGLAAGSHYGSLLPPTDEVSEPGAASTLPRNSRITGTTEAAGASRGAGASRAAGDGRRVKPPSGVSTRTQRGSRTDEDTAEQGTSRTASASDNGSEGSEGTEGSAGREGEEAAEGATEPGSSSAGAVGGAAKASEGSEGTEGSAGREGEEAAEGATEPGSSSAGAVGGAAKAKAAADASRRKDTRPFWQPKPAPLPHWAFPEVQDPEARSDLAALTNFMKTLRVPRRHHREGKCSVVLNGIFFEFTIVEVVRKAVWAGQDVEKAVWAGQDVE